MPRDRDTVHPVSKPRRILVSGGAGFIGSQLCAALLEQGHAVTCLDDFSTGTVANIRDLLGHSRFTLLEQDVRADVDVAVDEIYNLACPASPAAYLADPDRTTRVSLLGAINLLDLARRQRATILQASTSEIYGTPDVHPQAESYRGSVDPAGPRACYAEAKRCAETLFYNSHRQHGTAIRVARIFNSYGPGMRPDDGRVVASFIVAALRGQPLLIDGDGSQTRSFCHIDDLVAGLIALMRTDAAASGPVNLGNPCETTIRDLATLVLELTDSRSALQFVPDVPGQIARRQPDISRARQLLDWQPATPLRLGLVQTIAHFDRLLAMTLD